MKFGGYSAYDGYHGKRKQFKLPLIIPLSFLIIAVSLINISDYLVFSANGIRFGLPGDSSYEFDNIKIIQAEVPQTIVVIDKRSGADTEIDIYQDYLD